MILIVSEPHDAHAQAVTHALKHMGTRDVRLLDLSNFPTRLSMTMRIGAAAGDFALTFEDDARVPMSEVTAVWWRRPQMFVLPAGMTPAYRQFAMSEAATAFQGLWQASHALWVNDVVRDAAASHKPWQLELARRVGLHIPETLMTNDPEAARAFWASQPQGTVYKAFSATHYAWRETRLLRQDEWRLADAIRWAPVIFQAYVPATHDLRVTVVGQQLFAAAARTEDAEYPVDVRFNHVQYQPHPLPPEVERKLLAFMTKLGLEYGAIDLRLTPDGEYIFLEVNPAGQFLYIEHATGLPISLALASHLNRGRVSTTSSSQPAAAAD